MLLAALAVGAGVAGCGGSASEPTTSSGPLSRGDRAFLQFTVCMRRHGVHMADPYHRSGHAGLTLDLPERTPATTRAYSSCNHLIASVAAMKAAGMQARANAMSYQQRHARQLGLLHYAQCMRARGIPMLDPDANGALSLGNVPGTTPTGRYTPLFRTADRACRGTLPAGVADDGSGP
jgi:hypothetical protein